MLMPFALSKPGTWYGINVASRVDPKLMKLTRGRVNLGGNVLPTLLLTDARAQERRRANRAARLLLATATT